MKKKNCKNYVLTGKKKKKKKEKERKLKEGNERENVRNILKCLKTKYVVNETFPVVFVVPIDRLFSLSFHLSDCNSFSLSLSLSLSFHQSGDLFLWACLRLIRVRVNLSIQCRFLFLETTNVPSSLPYSCSQPSQCFLVSLAFESLIFMKEERRNDRRNRRGG